MKKKPVFRRENGTKTDYTSSKKNTNSDEFEKGTRTKCNKFYEFGLRSYLLK